MKQHIENDSHPGVALCGAPYEAHDPALTVVFCQDCIVRNGVPRPHATRDAYREGYEDGLSACITMLKQESNQYGYHAALADAAVRLQVLRDTGKLQP